MHKVQRMATAVGPVSCLVCGRGNTPDAPDTEVEFWALDLERDVNWGDPTFLCKYCCEKIATICGFVDEAELENKDAVISEKNQEIHSLTAKLEQRELRLTQILTGNKAVKRARRDLGVEKPKSSERTTKRVRA